MPGRTSAIRMVIRPLADPSAFGADPADAFEVVVPSLPGFGFAVPMTATGIDVTRTADLTEEARAVSVSHAAVHPADPQTLAHALHDSPGTACGA